MKIKLRALYSFYKQCGKSDTNFIFLVVRFIYYKFIFETSLFLHQNVKIKGINNLHAKDTVSIGTGYVGFIHKTDLTYLNIKGKLLFAGKFSIGRGCRFDIGEKAIVTIGKRGYINANTNIIIMHQLTIGDDCAISWDCRFLDEDFHEINYEGKKGRSNSIYIGNNVWIGSGVKIYKGTYIPDGCVVASNSIVRNVFNERNALIAGNPARIIKKDVTWK